jgi:hypothetical protein
MAISLPPLQEPQDEGSSRAEGACGSAVDHELHVELIVGKAHEIVRAEVGVNRGR